MMDSDWGSCQVCEATHRALTCTQCLAHSRHFGDDWARLKRLQAHLDAKRCRLQAELRHQARLQSFAAQPWLPMLDRF